MCVYRSEETLTTAFEQLLSTASWQNRFPRFTDLVLELDCHQGRPDLVAATSREGTSQFAGCDVLTQALSDPMLVRILSVLKPVAPRTEDYVLRTTGLSTRTMRRGLRSLVDQGLVSQTGNGYAVSSLVGNIDTEMWAFEVKLVDWQRALFQALQYQAFAHRVAVVVSEVGARRIEPHLLRFRTLGVGVIAVSNDAQGFRVLQHHKKRQPSSRFHYLYALGKFLNGRGRHGALVFGRPPFVARC
jgi:hypothetical protein